MSIVNILILEDVMIKNVTTTKNKYSEFGNLVKKRIHVPYINLDTRI